MKEDEHEHDVVIACRPNPRIAVSPVAAFSPAQPSLPTPSPFSYSVASTRWSSTRPLSIQTFNLILRFLVLVFSFASLLSLAALSPTTNKFRRQSTHFLDYPQLLYCFIVNIFIFIYSAYQLFKGVCDIAHRGIFITDVVAEYISFILDYVGGYLLVSASSVGVTVTQQIDKRNPLWKAVIVSIFVSFASFVVIAVSALLSGYKLSKRIGW